MSFDSQLLRITNFIRSYDARPKRRTRIEDFCPSQIVPHVSMDGLTHLAIASRHVVYDCVSEHMIQRTACGNISCALANNYCKLGFAIQLCGKIRIVQNRLLRANNAISGLNKEFKLSSAS